MSATLTRRHLLRLTGAAGGTAVVTGLLAACGGGGTALSTGSASVATTANTSFATTAPVTSTSAAMSTTAASAAASVATSGAATTSAASSSVVSRSATAAPTSAAAASGKGTPLDFYVWGADPERKVWQSEADAFHQQSPDVTVNVQVLGGGFGKKLSAELAAGTPPDSFYSNGLPFSSVPPDQLLTLDDYIQRDKVNLGDYFPVTIQSYTYQGHLYTLPNECGPFLWYFDQVLFKAAGTPTPLELAAAGTWDWPHLVSAAQATTKLPDQYGLDLWTGQFLQAYALSQGSDFVDNEIEPTTSYWNKPAAVDALQFYADLHTKYKLLPTPAWQKQYGGTVGLADEITTGRLAMGMQGAWERLFIASAQPPVTFAWDVAMFPKGSAGAQTVSYADGVVGAKLAKNHDATWQWIKFMGGDTGNKLYAGLIAVPPLKSVAETWFPKQAPINNKIHAQLYIDGLNASKPQINFPNQDKYNKVVNPEIDKVAKGQTTPQDAANAIHTQLMSSVFTKR